MTKMIDLGMPIHRLRKLGLDEFMTHNLIKIFEGCPLLEDVRVSIFDDPDDRPPIPPRGVVMHHLQRLTMSYDTDPTAIIDLVTTPNLTEFSTGLPESTVDWPDVVFLEFLRRSRASLRKLKLGYSKSFTSDMWENIIDATRSAF